MRRRIIYMLTILSSISVLQNGCFSLFRPHREKTLKETALDEMWYISTPKQRKTLKELNTSEEIEKFLEDFWRKLDPTPGTPENELRTEYYKRVEYANEHYPERRGWGKSDRSRVYIIYGPPNHIIRYPWITVSFPQSFFSKTKSMEIWIYDRPAGCNRVPNVLVNLDPGKMKFVFADFEGLGIYTQVYSTEPGEVVDQRIYR